MYRPALVARTLGAERWRLAWRRTAAWRGVAACRSRVQISATAACSRAPQLGARPSHTATATSTRPRNKDKSTFDPPRKSVPPTTAHGRYGFYYVYLSSSAAWRGGAGLRGLAAPRPSWRARVSDGIPFPNGTVSAAASLPCASRTHATHGAETAVTCTSRQIGLYCGDASCHRHRERARPAPPRPAGGAS